MAITTFRKLLPVACAALLFIALAAEPSLGQQTAGSPAPVELSGITFEYAVLDSGGNLVWETPATDKPNVIPSEAQRLRFRATVTNREPGARVRLKAVLQEVCPSPDAGKKFISKLRHMTETDPGNLTPDPADDEEQVVKADGTVSVELLVHCDTCTESVCAKKCGDHRDHLGEGPHVVDLTGADAGTTSTGTSSLAARHSDSAPAAASSIRMDLSSVCPVPQRQKEKRTAPRPRVSRGTSMAPRSYSSAR
jgi:hypothetical protein